MLYIVIISDSLPQEGNYNVTRSLLKRFPYYPSSATRVSTATCNKKGRRTSKAEYKERKRERGGRGEGVERRGNVSRERIFVSDWKSRAHKIVIYECARFAPLVRRLARWTAFNCGSNAATGWPKIKRDSLLTFFSSVSCLRDISKFIVLYRHRGLKVPRAADAL